MGLVIGYFVSYLFQNPLVMLMMGFWNYVAKAPVILTTSETVWPAVVGMFLGAGIGLGLALRK